MNRKRARALVASVAAITLLLSSALLLCAPVNGQDSAGQRRFGSQIDADLENVSRIIAPTSFAPSAASGSSKIAETSPEDKAIEKSFSRFHLKTLPAEPAQNHATNGTLTIGPFHENELIPIPLLNPIRLEASYSQPVSLNDVLNYAIENSLPIRISRESWNYQHYQYWSTLISALPIPNFSMGYNDTSSHTVPSTNSNAQVFQPSLRYPVFQGGGLVAAALVQYYRYKGWQKSYYATVNDALLDVYQKYTNLLLQYTLLEIRVKAQELSKLQLQLTNSQYRAGTTTQFAIMQSRTQLATDRQALVQQQVQVRQAALLLAYALNMPMEINLVPKEDIVKEASMFDPSAPIDQILNVTISHRPELKQYEMFRLAAARGVQVAVAPLYPTVSFFTTYTKSKTVVNPPGGSQGGVAVAQITPFLNGSGQASNNALGQTASFSPTGSTTANSGVNNTVATQIVAASGGMPLNNVQSGSIVTSGAVAPSFASGGSGGSSTSNINGSNTAAPGVFGGSSSIFQGGFQGSWSLSNLGLSAAINGLTAQSLVPQAWEQANQELLLVTQQVRADYLQALSARTQIDNAAYGAESARESLRLANLRLSTGAGTNLEAIQAERDYINALVAQAQAVIGSNLAQAQLIHDMGVISVDALTHDYKRMRI